MSIAVHQRPVAESPTVLGMRLRLTNQMEHRL